MCGCKEFVVVFIHKKILQLPLYDLAKIKIPEGGPSSQMYWSKEFYSCLREHATQFLTTYDGVYSLERDFLVSWDVNESSFN